MSFEFATAGRIIFGSGSLSQIGGIAAPLGTKALVVTGRNQGRASRLLELIRDSGIEAVCFSVAGEPTVEIVERGAALAGSEGCGLVVSMGGGSVIDAGKAIAAMLGNEGELLDYLEVIGRGRMIERPGAPFIAIPTTAGTGAEVTRNAVLGFPELGVKASLRSPFMLPQAALVDPQLTLGLPPEITAATGLDALTQLIEAAASSRANPMTDALCEQGIRLVMRSIEKAFREPDDISAREDMSLAAMWSGIALANAGLGAVHGFAAPIGGMFSVPHGAVCAALLPAVWKANAKAVADRGTAGQRAKFRIVSGWILKGEPAEPEAAGDHLKQLCERLSARSLAQLGVAPARHSEIAAKALNASSMRANPVPLTEAELSAVLNDS